MKLSHAIILVSLFVAVQVAVPMALSGSVAGTAAAGGNAAIEQREATFTAPRLRLMTDDEEAAEESAEAAEELEGPKSTSSRQKCRA